MARIVVSLLLVVVLVWRLPDVRWSDLVPEWSPSVPWWVAAALVGSAATLALQALRWGAVLRVFDRSLPASRLFSHTIAGQFVSNVLPTSFGGDVIRVSRSGRDLDDYPTAFAAVVLERLVGWVVLPLIAVAGVAFSAEVRDSAAHLRVAMWVGLGTVLALGAILGAASLPAAGRLANRSGWKGYIGAVHTGVRAMARHPLRMIEVLAAGTAFQVLLCAVVWTLARAVGAGDLSFAAILALFPAVAISQNLPIGLGGLGVREGAFVFFLAGMGVSQAASISLGLALYLTTVAVSVIGAPALARTASPVRPPSERR